jgi:hypothetical protein
MRIQEQALRAYYASMTETELLHTAANKSSFIALAQRLLTEELTKRHLQVATAPPGRPVIGSEPSLGVAKLTGMLRHAFHH